MAQLIDHLKKQDMANEAARLLDGSGWLPEPLRLPGEEPVDTADDQPDPDAIHDGASVDEPSELPAFLVDDAPDRTEEPDGDEADHGHLQAAE